MKKQFMSAALAGAMALSLAVPAFSAGTSTKVSGTYKDVPIAVVVPTTGAAVINPYGLPVEVVTGTTITGQQISTAPMAIKNQGSVDLTVGATVTGAVKKGSDLTLVTKTTEEVKTGKEEDRKAADTAKNAYVILEVVDASADGAADAVKALKGAETAIDALIKTACTTDATWEGIDGVVVNPDEETVGEDLATLKAATMKTDGTFNEYAVGSVAPFRLSGDCVKSPADSPWTTKDGFDVTIAFSFEPATT